MRMRHFFKIVIFQALRVFNRLLKTESVKKYILREYLLDEKNNNLLKRKMKNLLNQ